MSNSDGTCLQNPTYKSILTMQSMNLASFLLLEAWSII